MANSTEHAWKLEVVRGADIGRVFALQPGASVLGNGLNGEPGIDLAPQEGSTPRKMAPRQAKVESSGASLTLLDLDSPGGTFVNRQRVLPGQARPLQAGDVIQLGGVQLRVVTAPPKQAPSPSPSKVPVPVAAPAPKAKATRTAEPVAAPAPKVSPARPVKPAPALTAKASPKPAPPAAPIAAPAKKTPAPSPPEAAPVRTGPLSMPFALASGTVCRTWDDFLTASSRNWPALRDELTSGRLTLFLTSVGHADLAPPLSGAGTADEQLDAWLARIPATRAAQPDMEVFPAVLRVRAVKGGGTVRQKVTVTNTGYRLLRSKVKVDPAAAASWLLVAPAFSQAEFATSEQTEVALEVRIPETLDRPLTAALVVEGNGGWRRVEVKVEPPVQGEPFLDTGPAERIRPGIPLTERLAAIPAGLRIIGLAAGVCAIRTVLWAGDLVAARIASSGAARPALGASALALAIVGAALGAMLARRRGEASDVPTGAFAGGFAGVLLAALSVAACRSIEPWFAFTAGGSLVGTAVFWAALAGFGAGVSTVLVPYRKPAGGEA